MAADKVKTLQFNHTDDITVESSLMKHCSLNHKAYVLNHTTQCKLQHCYQKQYSWEYWSC